jgi:hypothetical protein
MTDVIRAVSGDELPEVTVSLTDEATGVATDLSAVDTTIAVKFHLAGSTTVLSTITCTKVGDGTTGQFTFDFTGGVLTSLAAGAYEGDILITYGSDIQTVFDTLRFRIRAAVA